MFVFCVFLSFEWIFRDSMWVQVLARGELCLTDLSWPFARHLNAWTEHRPEHWKCLENQKGKGYIACAWDSGTSGHVPFHRLSWTLPSTLNSPTAHPPPPQSLEMTNHAVIWASNWMNWQICRKSFLSFVPDFMFFVMTVIVSIWWSPYACIAKSIYIAQRVDQPSKSDY